MSLTLKIKYLHQGDFEVTVPTTSTILQVKQAIADAKVIVDDIILFLFSY